MGNKKVELFHLQFAGSTILFCPAKVKTVKNYKRIMECFGIMAALSINYDKLAIIAVNVDEDEVPRLQK